ncbi:MAG: hypothetical protein LRS46_03410 [Desulfurococcales archaeon]|nr:hypothetical protein [Desulfurococcales archaeon]
MEPSEVLCPRCHVPMSYIQESERRGVERRIERYYRCPICGLKIVDEILRVIKINGSIRLVVEKYVDGPKTSNGRTRRPPSRRRHSGYKQPGARRH